MRARRATITALLLACACACSSPSTLPTSAETAPASTSATAITAVPPTATSTALEVPTSTSAAPTTTAVVPVDHEQLVRRSYEAFMAGYWTCLRSPTTCDPAVLTALDSAAFRTLSDTLHDMRVGGFRIGADNVGYTVIESVTVDVSAGRATVMTCNWDTAVLYGPPARAGGPEVVMNNKRLTTRFRSVMYLDAGAWKLGEEHGVESTEEVNTCPPAS